MTDHGACQIDMTVPHTNLNRDQLTELVADMPENVATTLLQELDRSQHASIGDTPLALAQHLDDTIVTRPHLDYAADRLAQAEHDVRNGTSRRLLITMPPRSGKSTLTSMYLPTWLLAMHPEWSIGMISHEDRFATLWGRQVRRLVELYPNLLGVDLAYDLGAASEWETTEGGGIISRSINGSITGRGMRAVVLDDLIKDSATAHSATVRDDVWERWLSTIMPRMEHPFLAVALGTRWHEDDVLGRMLSYETEGDPDQWEHISFPAIAEPGDLLGREPGEPLYTPLHEETEEEALARWNELRHTVGTYAFSALYQQSPTPAEGAIFNIDWLQYHTDADRPTVFDRVLTSWDCAFKDNPDSDYVVGQLWGVKGADRYLLHQVRGKWSFTETLDAMRRMAQRGQEHLVEDKANGPAVLQVLRREIPGMVGINPTTSKEARARAVTPQLEAGNVFIPHPSEGEWVQEFMSELRAFPSGVHDDQVDALTQALSRVGVAQSRILNPNQRGRLVRT